MTESAAEIAERLRAVAGDRAAFQRALAELFAESVELRHDPPLETDGPIPGALIAEISLRETQAATRALPASAATGSEVTVEGDGIRVIGRTTGTLADGTHVAMATNTLFTVAGGQIVGLQSDMDESSRAAWGQILRTGGFTLPE